MQSISFGQSFTAQGPSSRSKSPQPQFGASVDPEIAMYLGLGVLTAIFGVLELVMKARIESRNERRGKEEVFRILSSKDLRAADFDQVVGHEPVKKKFRAWARRIQEDGGRTQKYMLLTGPPGTGKSLIVRAFAASISKDTRLIEVKCDTLIKDPLGVVRLEEMLRKLQKKKKPIVLFMDELSSVGNRRTGHADQINQLLRIMDGISGFKGKVAIVGTTNHPEVLDDAFRNRFQQILPVDAPDEGDRVQMLDFYLKRFNLIADESVDLAEVARQMDGMTGRKIEHTIEILQETLEDNRQESLLDVPEKERRRTLAEPLTFNVQQMLEAMQDATDWVKSNFELTA